MVTLTNLPTQPVRIGDALAAIGRKSGLSDEELSFIQRKAGPAKPMALDHHSIQD
jgi:hypothetical protein